MEKDLKKLQKQAEKTARFAARILRRMNPKAVGPVQKFGVKSAAHQETMSKVMAEMPSNFSTGEFVQRVQAVDPAIERHECKYLLRARLRCGYLCLDKISPRKLGWYKT